MRHLVFPSYKTLKKYSHIRGNLAPKSPVVIRTLGPEQNENATQTRPSKPPKNWKTVGITSYIARQPRCTIVKTVVIPANRLPTRLSTVSSAALGQGRHAQRNLVIGDGGRFPAHRA